MQIANLIRRPTAGTSSAKSSRAESKSAEQPHHMLVTLAELLPRFSVDRETAEATLDAIESRVGPRIVRKTPDRAGIVLGPLPEELEAQRRFQTRQRQDAAPAKARVERCRDKEAAAYFARECLALREAMKAAAPRSSRHAFSNAGIPSSSSRRRCATPSRRLSISVPGAMPCRSSATE